MFTGFRFLVGFLQLNPYIAIMSLKGYGCHMIINGAVDEYSFSSKLGAFMVVSSPLLKRRGHCPCLYNGRFLWSPSLIRSVPFWPVLWIFNADLRALNGKWGFLRYTYCFGNRCETFNVHKLLMSLAKSVVYQCQVIMVVSRSHYVRFILTNKIR